MSRRVKNLYRRMRVVAKRYSRGDLLSATKILLAEFLSSNLDNSNIVLRLLGLLGVSLAIAVVELLMVLRWFLRKTLRLVRAIWRVFKKILVAVARLLSAEWRRVRGAGSNLRVNMMSWLDVLSSYLKRRLARLVGGPPMPPSASVASHWSRGTEFFKLLALWVVVLFRATFVSLAMLLSSVLFLYGSLVLPLSSYHAIKSALAGRPDIPMGATSVELEPVKATVSDSESSGATAAPIDQEVRKETMRALGASRRFYSLGEMYGVSLSTAADVLLYEESSNEHDFSAAPIEERIRQVQRRYSLMTDGTFGPETNFLFAVLGLEIDHDSTYKEIGSHMSVYEGRRSARHAEYLATRICGADSTLVEEVEEMMALLDGRRVREIKGCSIVEVPEEDAESLAGPAGQERSEEEEVASQARASTFSREQTPEAPGAGITGVWLLRREGRRHSTPTSWMRLEQARLRLLSSGDGWTGEGEFDGESGYYNWSFADGRTGRTTIRLGENGILYGEVRGSGLDWNFEATRQ